MAVAVLFTIFVVWLGISAAAETRRHLASAVWLMFSSVAISLATREAVRGLLPDFHHAIRFGGDRYFFCGCCVFAYCLALAFEHWNKPAKRQPFAFALFFLLSSAVNFRIGPLRDLKWGSYAAQVDEWQDAWRSGRRHGEVSVPVNPEPWHIDLPGGELGE